MIEDKAIIRVGDAFVPKHQQSITNYLQISSSNTTTANAFPTTTIAPQSITGSGSISYPLNGNYQDNPCSKSNSK